MSARVVTAFVALAATVACAARSQDAVIWVDVAKRGPTLTDVVPPEEIKRYTPGLAEQLENVKADTLLLYTEYTAKAGSDLKSFLTNVTNYVKLAVEDVGVEIRNDGRCRAVFDHRLHKIEVDSHKAASFSADNHHKFLLGHMVVFRIHLNKSEDYIKKSDRAVRSCGTSCETTPRVQRWRRMAAEEIHRVQDDLQHSRRSYRDLVNHARRRLNHLRKLITTRVQDAVFEYQECIRRG
ncbi:uncharacterized protein LOC115442266 [Manduca sexta]|uniref:Uncharacterized protein n=1 Tax=Manduca sexta TaxID=7130 RepID=A0A921YZH6_MANSE|nr:uncharacterized protein LOC115442266 [Manduca sexta]KAG6448208.1 hypothetical protein O3G_MSEX005381 [Manduca sexta]